MPIYEYRCSSCGHQQEFLQKVSDSPVTVCTQCGKETFLKMLTAAGFQLKGSGWYATDFKNQGGAPAKPADAKGGEAKPAAEGQGAAEGKSDAAKESSKSAPASSPASSPASGSGTPTP